MTKTKRKKRKGTNKAGAAPGPKPDTLKIKGKWQDAVKKSFTKKRPVDGWPE
jgi:hypothetical protein